jgi:fatty-acyl-CoA synthase
MVMCGRIKDVIIIGGRNLYPQDIEKLVGRIDGVRAGNVIAFGQDGRNSKQHIVVVAETKLEDTGDLAHRITHEVTADIGVPPRHVVLVAPGTIPKTSSGKLQRSACRQMFESGDLVEVGPVIDVRRTTQNA